MREIVESSSSISRSLSGPCLSDLSFLVILSGPRSLTGSVLTKDDFADVLREEPDRDTSVGVGVIFRNANEGVFEPESG